jgi:hypothetical protein
LPLPLLFRYRFILKYYFSEEFKIKNVKYHSIITRRPNEEFTVPKYSNRNGQRCLNYLIPTIFNDIPVKLQQLNKYADVKVAIKSHLLVTNRVLDG